MVSKKISACSDKCQSWSENVQCLTTISSTAYVDFAVFLLQDYYIRTCHLAILIVATGILFVAIAMLLTTTYVHTTAPVLFEATVRIYITTNYSSKNIITLLIITLYTLLYMLIYIHVVIACTCIIASCPPTSVTNEPNYRGNVETLYKFIYVVICM